jgi:hypothetical protein
VTGGGRRSGQRQSHAGVDTCLVSFLPPTALESTFTNRTRSVLDQNTLGVTEEQLKSAVAMAGVMVADVRRQWAK